MSKYVIKENSNINTDEKLSKYGIQSLNDREIFNIVFEENITNNEQVAFNKLFLPEEIDEKKLKNNFQDKTIKKIIALKELIKRINRSSFNKITSPSEICKELRPIMSSKQENFALITLDGASGIIKKRILFKGTVNKSIIHPREIFYYVIKDRAAAFIIAHNHPSGNLQPSEDDIEMTKKIQKIAEIFCIPLLDHIIVTKNDYLSFSMSNIVF